LNPLDETCAFLSLDAVDRALHLVDEVGAEALSLELFVEGVRLDAVFFSRLESRQQAFVAGDLGEGLYATHLELATVDHGSADGTCLGL